MIIDSDLDERLLALEEAMRKPADEMQEVDLDEYVQEIKPVEESKSHWENNIASCYGFV